MPKAKVITAGVREGQKESLEVKLNNWLETAGDIQILHVGYVVASDKVVTAVIIYDEDEIPKFDVLSEEEVDRRIGEMGLPRMQKSGDQK